MRKLFAPSTFVNVFLTAIIASIFVVGFMRCDLYF
jgi:hypothetical protein